MDLAKTLEKINENRSQAEAAFVFSLWKEPELYEDYKATNVGKDRTIKTEEGAFYFSLGRAMYDQGYKTFDNITISTFLKGKPALLKQYEKYGGYHTVEDIRGIISVDNSSAYFDKLAKMNTLEIMATKFDGMFDNVSKFENYSNEDVYGAFDLLLNSASLATNNDAKVEDLVIDDDFIEEMNAGETVGLNYGKAAPLLNYITLGLPLGELVMLGAHSGVGKSSFVFEIFTMAMNNINVKTAIVSNEMRVNAYKILLIEHILTQELNYWGLTRKALRMGHFTDEQRAMLERAKDISREKYSGIRFVKTFDNDIGKIIKYFRKLARQGVQVIIYDTFKSDDSSDGDNMWQSLMLDARRLFQCCSRYNICCITTYQLALRTTNQRYLDANCLSNSKQIKEVYDTMLYMRPLWEDEYTGEKYDCKAYKLDRDNSKIKHMLELSKDKKYIVMFVDKTRSDEDKQQLLFEWNGRFNKWVELGWCKIVNDHRGLN